MYDAHDVYDVIKNAGQGGRSAMTTPSTILSPEDSAGQFDWYLPFHQMSKSHSKPDYLKRQIA